MEWAFCFFNVTYIFFLQSPFPAYRQAGAIYIPQSLAPICHLFKNDQPMLVVLEPTPSFLFQGKRQKITGETKQ
jgi:hypothetical protein